MADYLKLAQDKPKSKYQIWYSNPKNRAKVLAEQAARKAADPKAYSDNKKRQYMAKHKHYRDYQNNYYKENSLKIRGYQKAYNRTIEGLFKVAKRAANRRGLSWTITIEQLSDLRNNPCYYCGGGLPTTGHGLDRKDNSRGYEIDNVLPCCFDCNYHRGDSWTVEEAKAAIDAVLTVRGLK